MKSTHALLILLLFFSSACGMEGAENADYAAPVEEYEKAYTEAAYEELDESTAQHALTEDGVANAPGAYGGRQATPIKTPEKIIKDAFIGFEVESYNTSMANIRRYVAMHEGYFSKEDQEAGGYRTSNTLVIRIPNNNFDALVSDLIKEAKTMDYNRVNARDVTAEYIDVSARIKAKQEVEARYYEILKKAKNVEEVLQVEDKIRVIREELEAAQGRLRYLSDQVAYSTITLNVYEEKPYTASAAPGFWDEMGNGFEAGWEGILMFFIGLAYAWPLLILFAAFWLLVRFLIKRAAKRRAAKMPPAFAQS